MAKSKKDPLLQPLPGRPSKSWGRVKPTDRIQLAMRGLERDLGGRQVLQGILSTSEALDEREALLIALMADPQNDRDSLATLCQKAQVPFGRLLELFRRGKASLALAAAHSRIYDSAADVAEAVMERAKPRKLPCLRCQETGLLQVEEGKPPLKCPECFGAKALLEHPDHEVQKTALKISSILKEGSGGATVNVQQNNLQVGKVTIQTSPELRSAVDRLLHPGKHQRTAASSGVVEAEVVESRVEVRDEGEPADPAV